MEKNSTPGLNAFSLLGIVFVVLKLCKVIDWSWWWVTCPFWGGLLLFWVIFLIVFILKNGK